MQSSSSRLLLVSLALLLTLTQCQSASPDRTRVNPVKGDLEALIPDARLYPNDLATDRVQHIRNVWLMDNELLIEDSHGRLTCLSRTDGAPRWYFAGLPGLVEFDPAAGPLSVAVMSEGIVYELNRATGDQLHAFKIDFLPSASPALSDSTLYVPCLAATEGYQTLKTVNMATGLSGWGVSTRGSVPCSPYYLRLPNRAMLYFATERGEVFAYQAAGSSAQAPDPIWSSQARGRVVTAPAVYGDAVFVGSEAGDLWAYDRITGAAHWVRYSGHPILTSPWASGDQVYFLNSVGFHALSADEGKPLWTLPAQGQFVARRGNDVYVRTAADGRLHALDAATGEILRSASLPKNCFVPANPGADGTIYVVTEDGYVTVIGKKLF